MPMAKAFALMCCVFSLFVQGAAYAAAMPQGAMAADSDCAGMAARAESPRDAGNCCDDMALDCLVSMGCIAPLAMPEPGAANPVSLVDASTYTVLITSRLDGKPIPPEFPPPQSIFAG